MESPLALFLTHLAEEGRAVVSPQSLPDESEDALPILQRIDLRARDELGPALPEFSSSVALWAARLFHDLCQFTVCRDIPEDRIIAACRVPCPRRRSPETDWSADLVMRQLPKLFQLARHLSTADPLVARLKELAAAWPLSSVDIAGLESVWIDSFIGHAMLRRLYADRILAAGDVSRMGDPRIDDLLRGDLGVHRELAPTIAARLFATP